MSDEPPELGDVVDFEFSGSPDGRRFKPLEAAIHLGELVGDGFVSAEMNVVPYGVFEFVAE